MHRTRQLTLRRHVDKHYRSGKAKNHVHLNACTSGAG